MAGKSNIEWTEQTWNPIVGCSIVSPGCTNCYAMKMAARIEAMDNQPRYAGTTRKVNGNAIWTGKLARAPDSALLAPLKRKKPTTYFVNSMGDLFHEDCPDEWIDRVFAVMALSPQHTFQVLTKRAKRMRDYCLNARVRAPGFVERACGIAQMIPGLDTSSMHYLNIVSNVGAVYPLPNVWLGVSTERQQEADERIPLLLQTPAAVRFISAEPLLGPIKVSKWLGNCHECGVSCGWRSGAFDYPEKERCHHCGTISLSTDIYEFCPSCGHQDFSGVCPECEGDVVQSHPDTPSLDWVIVGGESGHGYRPMETKWASSLRDQCVAASVPVFIKQMAGKKPIPPDLLVRQFPSAA